MSASEACKRRFPLIEQLNDDQELVEIVSKGRTAHLVSTDQRRSMETAHFGPQPDQIRFRRREIAPLLAEHGSLVR